MGGHCTFELPWLIQSVLQLLLLLLSHGFVCVSIVLLLFLPVFTRVMVALFASCSCSCSFAYISMLHCRRVTSVAFHPSPHAWAFDHGGTSDLDRCCGGSCVRVVDHRMMVQAPSLVTDHRLMVQAPRVRSLLTRIPHQTQLLNGFAVKVADSA